MSGRTGRPKIYTGDDTVFVHIRLPLDLHTKVKEEAARLHISMTDYVRMAVADKVK